MAIPVRSHYPGTFVGGLQTIGTISRNQWAESCHTFFIRQHQRAPSGYLYRARDLHAEFAVNIAHKSALALVICICATLGAGSAIAATFLVDDGASAPTESHGTPALASVAPRGVG